MEPTSSRDAPSDDLETADVAVAHRAARQRHHPVMRWLGTASEIADQPQLATLCGATVVAGFLSGNPVLAATGLRMLAAHALATWIKGRIKNRVERPRPDEAMRTGRFRMRTGRTRDGNRRSFPSGHTAGAVAVAGVVAVRHPAAAVPACALALAASLIQVPRGKHYPTDLAAGFAIGTLSAAAALGVFRGAARLARR